ncbi:MAG: hypothetical protein IPN90_08705 [Elusimicrobia bacterium]|nr:hypothetical protein [Elusimicrobiota bacterium]
MRAKPLDLRRLSEQELVLILAHTDEDFRRAAFQELGARGEKRGWEAYGLLTRDPELARLFVSPKDPFDAVGVMVTAETYGRVRAAWPDVPEQNREDGGKELTIDFRNLRLDVMTLGPATWPLEGETPKAREGLGEVEFRVSDVAIFAARVENLEDDLRGRLTLLASTDPEPQTPPTPSPTAKSRFLLAQVPTPRGVRTVLVQLIQA